MTKNKDCFTAFLSAASCSTSGSDISNLKVASRMWSHSHTPADTHTHTHRINSQTHTRSVFTDSPESNETLRLTRVSWSCAGRRRPPAPCTCWPAPLSPRRQVNPAGPASSPGDGNRKRWTKNVSRWLRLSQFELKVVHRKFWSETSQEQNYGAFLDFMTCKSLDPCIILQTF